MKKITTLALTGALALGALGIGSMSDLPFPGMQAQEASAAGTHSKTVTGAKAMIYGNPNAIRTWSDIYTTDAGEFSNGEPRWLIKNSVGTVVKSGSMSGQEPSYGLYPGRAWSTKETNISLAGLPNNGSHYRIDFTWKAADKLITKTHYPELTKAFTFNLDGTVTNIRD